MLDLKLLSSPQILLHERPVRGLTLAKSQALLFYLALNRRPHSRLALAGLLWPEKREADALANLRQALYHLRNALPDYLLINRLTVAFNQDLPCQIDLLLFEQASSETNDITAQQKAVDYYTGEFLAGFHVDEAQPFEEWAVITRERLHQAATQTLQQLVHHYDDGGETTLGLRYVNQWLALEPWHEEAHRQKMRLLAWAGQPQAALTHYERCRQVLAEELGAAPSTETVALVEQIRRGEIEGTTRRQEDKKIEAPTPSIQNRKSKIENQHDWGEAPEVGLFYGRQAELNQVTRWLVNAQSRLVTVVGMGGMGKTALAAKVTRTIADHFTVVIWRSLLNAPPLEEIVGVWGQRLVRQAAGQEPTSLAVQLNRLFDLLSEQRCLLILDNVESILQSEVHAGHYRPGYEGYGQLFQRFGASNHQSCLLLTSREQPHEVARLAQTHATVHTLHLTGLTVEAAGAMLAGNGVTTATAQTQQLIAHYSGNPLALMLVAETIQELFAGDLAGFLQEGAAIFGDIRDVLDQQWLRLTALEQDILLWLAIVREPVAAQYLAENIQPPAPQHLLLEALNSLRRRALIEQHGATFTLQNVVTEYVTSHLINTIEEEVAGDDWRRFHSHALIQAQAKEYVRESQIRMILAPLAACLVQLLGRDNLVQRLCNGVAGQRQHTPPRPGYAAGNALNLLVHLNYDLRNYDFSHLCVWQAHLQHVRLPSVNFAHADLKGSLFAEPFRSHNTLAWSPDGALLAAAGSDGVIRVWRTADRQLACICAGHEGSINALAFSPDGQLLASGSVDRTVGIWAIGSHQLRMRLHGHTRAVQTLVWSRDGQWLISGSWDNTIRIWSLSGTVENSEAVVLSGHTDSVQGLTLSPDGTRLASVSFDRTLCVWDLASVLQGKDVNRAAIHTIDHNEKLMATAWSPDGRLLVSGGIGQTVYIWNASSRQLLHTLPITAYNTRCLAFSPDNALLAVGNGTSVRLWAVDTWRLCSTLERRAHHITAIAWHPHSNQLATVAWEVIRIWDVVTGQVVNSLSGYFDEVLSVIFSADGTLAASSHVDDIIRIWDTATWQVRAMLAGHKGLTRDVRFSPDGATLISAGVDQTVRLWDSHSGEQRRLLRGHDNWISSMTTSPDGHLIATGSHDRTVWLWETAHGQVRHVLHAHSEMIQGLAFSPDSQLLATGSGDATIRLWNTRSGQALRTLQGHADEIHTLVFDRTGSLLISGSTDETIGVWGVHSGQRLRTLCGHTAIVCELAMSPDGTIFASCGSADQTVRLWDLASGEPLQVLPHGVWVVSIAFSPDGQTLLTGCEDGHLWLWDVQTGQCRRVLRAPGPYAGMNITGVTGITDAQKAALKALGAIEAEPTAAQAVGTDPDRLWVSRSAASSAGRGRPEGQSSQESSTLASMPRHNLPAQTTSFVGRSAELADLTQKLRQPACRLLTLIGLGGSGKTRLAIEAARQVVDAFPDGVYFVALAALEEAMQIPQHIMAAIGLTSAGDSDPLARLLDYLTNRRLLLLLDNLEQIPDSAALLVTLIERAPAVTLLCTSRTRLNLRAEWQIDMTGLATPGIPDASTDRLTEEAVATLAQTEAVQLFTERAQYAWRAFGVDAENLAAILRICHLVGGMPLALELAAGWVRLLSCTQIADELAQNLAALTTTAHDVPDRQRSIQSVLEATWRQLDAHTQAVLPTLALFQGGFHYRAAAAVAGATLPALANLLDHSLIHRPAPERYAMHELLRQFAHQKLTAVPALWHKAAADHAHFFATFLAGYHDLLIGDVAPKAAALEDEWENLRVAWRWLVQSLPDPDALGALATMVDVLYRFFDLRSRYREGMAWFAEALRVLEQPAPCLSKEAVLLRGKLLGRLARFHYYLSQVTQTEQLAQQALTIATEHGETSEAAFCWLRLGYVANAAGDYPTALQHLTQSHTLYGECNDDEGIGWALNGLGVMQQNSGRMSQARPYYQAAHQQAQRLNHALLLETTLQNLGKAHYELGEYDQALTCLQAGLELNQRLATQEGTAYALLNMAPALANQGKLVEAHEYNQRARALFNEIGHQRGVVFALVQLTAVAQLLNQLDTAERYITEAEQIVQRLQLNQLTLMVTTTLARLRFAQNDWRQAQALAQQVLTVCQSSRIESAAGYAQVLLGEIALAQQAYAQAQAYFGAAGALARSLEMPPLLLEALTGQARVFQQQGAYERAATLLHFVVTQRALTAAVRGQAHLALIELEPLLSAAAARQSHLAAAMLTVDSAWAWAGMTPV